MGEVIDDSCIHDGATVRMGWEVVQGLEKERCG